MKSKNDFNLNAQTFFFTILSPYTNLKQSKITPNLVLESNSICYISKYQSSDNSRSLSNLIKNNSIKQARKCSRINSYHQRYKIARLVKEKGKLKDLAYKDNLLEGYYNKNAFNKSIKKAKLEIDKGVKNKFNHQYLAETLNTSEKIRINITNFSLLLIDIDNFKQINDSLGHFVGDIVLKVIGNCISHSIKSYDEKFRWGGDEIALILYNVDEVQTEVIAERIRFNVENYSKQNVADQINRVYLNNTSKIENIMKNIDSINFSVSIGGANFRHLESLMISSSINILNYIFEVADEKLYEAKRSGRNTVRIKKFLENKV